MESTVNKLIEIRSAFTSLAKDKNLNQGAKDDYSDKAAAVTDAIDTLAECFDLKICDHCGAAFEKLPELDVICAGCEEHKANRYASDRADREWHSRIF